MKLSSSKHIVYTSGFLSAVHAYGTLSLPSGTPTGDLNQPIDLTIQQQIQITHLHNKWRENTALGKVGNLPQASNMQELTWDPELAKFAKIWANACNFEHTSYVQVGDQTVSDHFGFSFGENLAIAVNLENTEKNINDMIEGWANEYKNMNSDLTGNGGVIGHYTQMVWADTNKIGCAISMCHRIAEGYGESSLNSYIDQYDLNGWNLVCHYTPPGNWIDQVAYKTGSTGSECSARSTNYPGLCSSDSSSSSSPNDYEEIDIIETITEAPIQPDNQPDITNNRWTWKPMSNFWKLLDFDTPVYNQHYKQRSYNEPKKRFELSLRNRKQKLYSIDEIGSENVMTIDSRNNGRPGDEIDLVPFFKNKKQLWRKQKVGRGRSAKMMFVSASNGNLALDVDLRPRRLPSFVVNRKNAKKDSQMFGFM